MHIWGKDEHGVCYTGTDAGGMEIGAHNIIAVGTSVPHNRPVKGMNGFNGGWNLYAIVTDRETGKTVHKWLTKYDPSKSTGVEYARLVKLSDYRFAVLCTIKGRLHYYAIDNNGNIKVHKKYPKKYAFTSSTQPVLYKGSIIWTEETFSKKNNTQALQHPRVIKNYKGTEKKIYHGREKSILESADFKGSAFPAGTE